MRTAQTGLPALAFLIVLLAPSISVLSRTSSAAPPSQSQLGHPAFGKVWERTDTPVQQVRVQRSFYWGRSLAGAFSERYDEGPGGKHLVQYFEKSRMEVNDPKADPNSPFFVTNGQLAKELITGRVQIARDGFVQLGAAQVAIASDTSDNSPGTPTYASFVGVLGSNPRRVGELVSATINRAGQVGTDQSFANEYGVRYTYYEPATQNNIPDVFWNFLNASGLVYENGRQVTARLNDPYFYATGYPIAPAYWAKVTIAGKGDTAVLIQPYERRVLTYVPSAPEGWKVQMGNVGMHYFEWRYGRLPSIGSNSCEAPSGKIGQMWFARPQVQQWVGCIPNELPERGITFAHQTFQNGSMFDLITSTGLKTIYVLFGDGTAQVHQDRFEDGSPEPPSEAPPGLYAPRAGFGKVWRDANLRERLGWATAPETVAAYDPRSEPPMPPPVPTALPGLPTPSPAPARPTAVPASERGFPSYYAFRNLGVGSNLIVYSGPQMGKFYVVYNGGTRWAEFSER